MCTLSHTPLERDVAQWLERVSLPMSLPVGQLRVPLGAGFQRKCHVSPLLVLGHYIDVVSLGKALYPHYASLDTSVNEYLVRQRWKCVRLVLSAEMAAVLHAPKRELKWNMNEQVQ